MLHIVVTSPVTHVCRDEASKQCLGNAALTGSRDRWICRRGIDLDSREKWKRCVEMQNWIDWVDWM